jgi:hypothetical protein
MTFALIASVGQAGSPNGTTTGAIDTSGANLIVLAPAYYAPGAGLAISDSKANTWTALTERGARMRFYYCLNPTVGAGHTFTVSGTGVYGSMTAAAFSGAAASPFDLENGAASVSGTTLQPGSITPSEGNELVISAGGDAMDGTPTPDGGFTVVARAAFSGGVCFGSHLAYLVQTSAVAANPTWTYTPIGTGPEYVAMIASFKAAASGGSAPWLYTRSNVLMGLQ